MGTLSSSHILENFYKKIKLFSRKKDKFLQFKANNIYVRIIFWGDKNGKSNHHKIQTVGRTRHNR